MLAPLILCFASVLSANYANSKTIVIGQRETETEPFFDALSKFTTVSFGSPNDPIKDKYGQLLYDNAIFFGEGPATAFDMQGINVLVVAGAGEDGLDEALAELSLEVGVFFTEKAVSNSQTKEETITTDNVTTLKSITDGKKFKKVTYSGISMVLEKNNPLLIPVLSAEANAVTAPYEDDDTEPIVGSDNVLVAGLQARDGTRMGFVGSTDLFRTDVELMTAFTQWAFQQRGMLRARNAVGVHGAKIKDQMSFSVQIEEWTGKGDNDGWQAFKADDVQLEFTMIDPYIRKSMAYDTAKNDGSYSLNFQAPDVYGIFKYVVDYRRAGYSPLLVSEQTTVRPLRLNEYERFIPAAYPYYFSVLTAMIGFTLFGFFYAGCE